MPFSFSFSCFSFFLRFSPFVVLRVILPCSFFIRFVLSSCRFPFVSCIAFFLLRFSFGFPVFVGGGLCYSVISSLRYTPPALLASLKYRITRMKAHPGDNFLTFENIITGGALIGVCGIYRTPGDKHHAQEPRSWGCDNEGV